jgi:drug/metabolite transporter (DMT)-like permease
MDRQRLLASQSDSEEDDDADPPRPSIFSSLRVPLLAIGYCTVSISAVFLNKAILSRSGRFRGFQSVELLMVLQSIVGVLFLLVSRQAGVLSFPISIDAPRVKRIALVNILFVLMTCANAYSVRQLSLPMVALLKNCQVVIVCLLEFVLLRNKPGKMTIASLSVIVFGSFCGSVTDLEFNLLGYIWMAIAVTTSAVYYISIKFVFKENQV